MFYDLTGETKSVNDKIQSHDFDRCKTRLGEQQEASSAESLCSLCILCIDCRGPDNSRGGRGGIKVPVYSHAQQVPAVLAATQRLWFDGLTLPHHQLKRLRSHQRGAHAALKSDPGTLQYHRQTTQSDKTFPYISQEVWLTCAAVSRPSPVEEQPEPVELCHCKRTRFLF